MVLLKLFVAFVKVGIFAYGGGPSMMPLVREEVVDNHKWMTPQEFADVQALGFSLPGPQATKMSAYVGYRVARVPGLIAATLGIALPSILMMLALVLLFTRFKESPYIKGALTALKPIVIALVVTYVIQIWPNSVVRWHHGLVAAAGVFLMVVVNVHPAYVVVMGIALGAMLYS